MNVGELRKALEGLDDKLMVVVSGHDGGVNEMVLVEEVNLMLNANKTQPWAGKHKIVTHHSKKGLVEAVLLS
jgi:hypothetical protein